MNLLSYRHFPRTKPRLFSIRASFLLAATVLFAGLAPATAHAQGHGFGGRGFGGGIGRGFVGGLGFGIGLGISRDLFDPYVVYAPPSGYVVYSGPTYYVPPPSPQYVVVAPAPVTPAPTVVYSPSAAPTPAAAPVAPAPAANGKTGRIVYDSNGKPVGFILQNPDGKQEFVPLTQ